MLYEKLEKYIADSEYIKAVEQQVLHQPASTLFYGLNRSAKAVIMAHIFRKTGKNILFVSADDKIAEDYLDDFELLVGSKNCKFLPDYEVLPYEERSPHYVIRAQRIETMTAAVSGQPAIYNLSLRSFLRKMVPRDVFAQNLINLQVGKEYDFARLLSDLVSMGYENQYQVSKVGDIAHRGGILDIFTPRLHKPLRIEFFGDEVESIRVFSINSQKSTGEEYNEITLIPAREISLNDLDPELSAELWKKIHENDFYEGIELDVALLLPRVENFLNYFSAENCLIFWDEYQFFSSYFHELQEEIINMYAKARQKQNRNFLPDPEKIFSNKADLSGILGSHQNYFVSAGYQDFAEITKKLEAPFSSPDAYSNDLEQLELALQQKLKAGYQIIIQSDNRSQSKRMRDLLSNLEAHIQFTIGVFQKGFEFAPTQLLVLTDHEIFSRYRRKRRSSKFSKEEVLVDYDSLKPGDYIVHIDHGVGIFTGLKKLSVDGSTTECLTIKYGGNDLVYVPTYQLALVTRYVSEEGITPEIHKLGAKKWHNAKKRAKKQIELVAEDLIELYAERKSRQGITHATDSAWQQELEESFIYEPTTDQLKSTQEIKSDMESDVPMERLLCGDVGFGKTEVAIRAAFKAVMGGFQVAVLVPTTLLAEQHYLVFKERIAQYPVKIAMFSRFRSKKNLDRDVVGIYQGEVDIAIGTHRLLSKDIIFKNLGLLIVDEEHRFGVRHKDRLRQLKSNVDTLYMSATPIPRTLHMALSKLKELSLIRTSPKARLPIRTVIVPFDLDVVKDAINREMDRGGQVFFVHNRVQTIESMVAELRKLVPHAKFAVGHGQLPEKQLEAVMIDFADHKFDVLVASTIIENGIDIPNANTMIINRADMFGLAQIYQIRGRVGRSNRRAYAYLMIPPQLTEIARLRLETLIEYDTLGSGYQIAMRDMELRGAGSLLGTKQSGIINSIGFSYYNRLLEKAIENLQSDNPVEDWDESAEEKQLKNIRIEQDHYIPHDYISDQKERLAIYKRMLAFEKSKDFAELKNELKDRFGKLPQQVKNSLQYYRLKMLAEQANLKSVQLKANKFSMEFDNKTLPPRQVIAQLMKKFDYPVKFDTTGHLKIVFTILDPKSAVAQILEKALAIIDWLNSQASPPSH
jgi:transcription-repair coupling factor (superfamily II helicase)